MPGDYPQLELSGQDDWQAWLDANHESSDGVWLMFAKKASGITTVNYAEALDVALCFGWIDGHVKRLDDDYYLQKFTPRRKRSRWSLINTEHVARLIEEGRMRPAGQAQIDAAKADGRWDAAYASPSRAKVPADLEAELDKSKKAAEKFESLSKSARYTIVYAIEEAKRPETRARRIKKYVDLLNAGKGPYD